MNKGMKRLVSVLLAVLVLSALGATALAEDGELYTIRVFAGNVEGANINGQSVWTYTGSYGESIPFDYTTMVSLPEGSQYSVRGVRKSGYDNNQISPLGTITEDADYVVAYGITGQLVAYTVNFVDEAGDPLPGVSSQTYYGNVGDKPVVAYLYVDGYEPQAYNLTRTLSDNEANNVFTFVYSQIVVPTPVPAAPAPTPYVYTEGAEGGGAGAGAAGGAAAGGGLPAGGGAVELPGAGGEEAVAGEAVPEAGGPAAEAGGEQPAAGAQNEPAQQPEQEAAQEQEPETAQIEENETPQASGPQEIIDLDEEDTPLGGAPEVKEKPQTELQKEREQSEQKFYIAAGLLGVSLIAIVALVVALVRKRRV